MDGFGRVLWFILAGLAAWFFLPKLLGGGKDTLQPIGPGKTETAIFAPASGEPQKCQLKGDGYTAVFSSQGAALVDYYLVGNPRFTEEDGKPFELTTVGRKNPDRYALHFDWRALGTTGPDAQMPYDVVDWKLTSQEAGSCTFEYRNEQAGVALQKTFRAGKGPYEVETSATIENLSDAPKVHRLGVENTAWRKHSETTSHLGRQSPFVTEVACATADEKLERKSISDFAAKDFEKPGFDHGWFIKSGNVDFAATSNAYFAQALVPQSAPAAPVCALQIEERWQPEQYAEKEKDPNYGAMYRSRLLYPAQTLAPHQKATYDVLAYYGPKDRSVLAAASRGQHDLGQLINLGTFAIISKVLVSFLEKVHGVVGNWGFAIIILTICVRLILFPLTWKQIKSMVAMRRLKPEIDVINERFKDDAQQKQLAVMEVYRKNGVNPLSGCLPVVVQMPVWWALYATLQTAVELYHTPFLWFKDLAGPDPYFALPLVIGATSFVQQKMMPQQADMAQQRMMMYLMPGVFTVMMLFLPAGLGIYMLTNSILGIVQQQLIERFAPSSPSGGITVREKGSKKDDNPPKGTGRGGRKLPPTVPANVKGES
jgi:YidC/Oxa1 family membrane protein insertase